MDQPDLTTPAPPPVPTDPVVAVLAEDVSKGRNLKPGLGLGGIFAWLVVMGLTTILIALVAFGQFTQQAEIGGDASAGDLMTFQIQARALVGQEQLPKLLGAGAASEVELPEQLDQGCYEQRLGYAILVNEFEDSDAAQEYLQQLDDKVNSHALELTEQQVSLRNTLTKLFAAYRNGTFDVSSILTPSEAEALTDKLGFVGRLATLPEGTNDGARDALLDQSARTVLWMGIAVLLGFLAGLGGLLLSAFFMGQLLFGMMKSSWRSTPVRASVYIETFAIWMSLFFVSSLVVGLFPLTPTLAMILQPVIFFGSLVCLAWPVARGVAWNQVRQDIGWTSSRPLADLVSAPFTYLATLPWLFPGIVLAALIASAIASFGETHEFARQMTPSHPVQEFIASGNWVMIALVFVTACVAAPVVEETMFRGVLYRHLRDQLTVGSRTASVLLSGLISGFIFASIHPQGLAGVPVLMTLAVGFALAREWRGNLINPMVMHGIHNTLITVVTLLLL